jgi:superfamily II DNA or RNA helicase
MPLFDHWLRDYQKNAHVKIREDFKAGAKRLLIEMPTGTGKTRTFVLFPKAGARTMVIVPMLSLIPQTVRSIRDLRDCEADVEQADLYAVPETEFVVASWQTLIRNDRYKRFVGKVDLVIVDEAHWGFTIPARDLLNQLVEGGARVLGCTATAYRADRQALCGFYEKVSYCLSLRESIDQGWLVPPKVRIHYVKSVDLSGLAKKAGTDFDAEELDKILRSEETLQDLASLITTNHRKGAKGVVFAHSVKQATLLRDLMLDRHNMECSLVHSYQSDKDYSEELSRFTSGDRELIINVGCLTTGWDYPPLSEIFLAKPTKALNKYVQMVGRGTRSFGCDIETPGTAEGRKAAIAASPKPSFVIHDITDSSRCNKLCSALDVLSDQTGTIKQRVSKKMEDEEVSLDEIDQAIADEIEAERTAKRLEKEAERARRKRVVLGVEWASEDRDPFAEADRSAPSGRTWRFPFGKWKGQPLRAVEEGYLRWALREARLTPQWKRLVSDELNRRKVVVPKQQTESGRLISAAIRDMERRRAQALEPASNQPLFD